MALKPSDDLTDRVTDSVGYQLAGALLGYVVVAAVNEYTPLRLPWWVGIATGAAFGAAAGWSKENQ